MPVEIIWMSDAGNHNFFEGWDRTNWGTDFTAYRWAIPYLCGFKGRAIYLDVDTLLLGDIAELWKAKMAPNKAIISLIGNYSVMLMDCSKLTHQCFKDIDALKKNACIPQFSGAFNNCVTVVKPLTQLLPNDWNCLDGEGFSPDRTKLIHFTRKDTQPWQPYPERHKYVEHPRPDIVEIWFDAYSEAMNEAGVYTPQ
jgi:hypothetical protein